VKKDLYDELFRLFLVLGWIALLLGYFESTDSACFKDDLWDQYYKPTDSQLISGLIADSSNIKLTGHFLALYINEKSNNDSGLVITEHKKYSSKIKVNESLFYNNQLKIYPGLATKLASILSGHNPGLRIIMLSTEKDNLDSGFALGFWEILKYGLYLLLISGLIFTVYYFWIRGETKWEISNITILFICIVGIFQSAFIFIQGGLLISPVGRASSAIIPILLAHSITLYQTEKPKSNVEVLKWSLPFLIFTLGHIFAHLYSKKLYSPTSREILSLMFNKYYFHAYIIGATFSIFSLLSRLFRPINKKNKEIATEAGR